MCPVLIAWFALICWSLKPLNCCQSRTTIHSVYLFPALIFHISHKMAWECHFCKTITTLPVCLVLYSFKRTFPCILLLDFHNKPVSPAGLYEFYFIYKENKPERIQSVHKRTEWRFELKNTWLQGPCFIPYSQVGRGDFSETSLLVRVPLFF